MSKGYDNLPMLYQAVLDLPMFEGQGIAIHDIARATTALGLNHTMAAAGPPAWVKLALSNLTMLQFNSATPDRLILSAINSADMDFTTGPFSGIAWVFPHALAGNSTVISRWTNVTSGWLFLIRATGEISFYTVQATPALQVSESAAGAIVINTWYLIGFSRLGNSVRIYRNGVDVTAIIGNHIDPDTNAGVMSIGVDSAVAQAYDGCIWRPRVFSRQLSAAEMTDIFEMERGLFGV